MNVLALLSHNDDEYFVSARIASEVLMGHHIFVAYTTHGSARGTASKTRMDESLRVLEMLGVPAGRVLSLGSALEIPDGSAYSNLDRLYQTCLRRFDGVPFGRILTTAWEGGHPDHDATHLVAVALARVWSLEIETYEFPIYTRAGAPWFLFRAGRYPVAGSRESWSHMGILERLRLLALVRCYPSQWKTFLGLLPETGLRYLLFGVQPLRRVHATGMDYLRRPHPGSLLYEKRFGLSHERFRRETRSFVESKLS